MSNHHKATQHEKLYQPPNYFNKKLCAAHTNIGQTMHVSESGSYKKRSLFRGLKQHIKLGFALGVGALGVWALTPPIQGYLSSPYKMGKKKTTYKGSTHSKNIWHQIAKDFTLSAYANNPAVLQQIRWYQEHPKSLSDIATQAAPYLYYVHQQVKEKGLPGELVLLPIIESAYNPFASSHVGAAGLWQLMPRTGSDLGLKQNAGFDGRRDVVSSTQAALSYLDYLDKVFDKNWLLALAAYNSGPGTVLKADKNNLNDHSDTQFWSLHLPKETKQYVPRLLAVAAIISDPEKYGIQLPDVPNEPYFAKVTVDNPMPLSKVATLSDTPVAEVHSLNPGYTGTHSTSATPEHVLIPIEKVETFKQNMDAQGKTATVSTATTITPNPVPDNTMLTYTVTANDTLRKIAAHYHVNLSDLVKWNHLSRKSVLHKGQLLKLNATTSIATKATAKQKHVKETLYAATTTTKAKAAHHSAYKVRTGDTLGTIAKKQGIAVKSLHKANHLKSNHLKNGQVLKIPGH
ncbi:MAG: mltD 3 [Gammaproteobacteria bacterium]|jgi:membrane-bound lytic murein transglycosylase D|nr:mltD 3 [Gammaproteobacteria bacterium]